MFAAWGRFVYRWRWVTLAVSGGLLVISVLGLLMGGTFTSGGPVNSDLEAARARSLLLSELAADTKGRSSFLLIFRGTSQSVGDSGFKDAVIVALAPIESDARVTKVVTPYNTPNSDLALALTSKDGHEALVQVDLKSDGSQAQKDYQALRGAIRSDRLTVIGTGNVPINSAFSTTLASDLQRAETVTLPITLLLLLLIFGTVVAASLPLAVGILTILGGLAATLFLTRFGDVSEYAINVVTLIGLGVAIDYSLFIVNRFRDELVAGATPESALANTMATAGRAITFSGLTVAIGLSAMLFYQGTFMASMGVAGAIVVGLAVLYALTFLPALLAVIGPAVNRLRLPSRRSAGMGSGFWHGLATWIMRRPLLVLLPTVAFLLVAASPFLSMRIANGSADMLPTHLEARQGYDLFVADFPGQKQTTFQVVVNYPSGTPLTAPRIGDQFDLDRRIASIPGVLRTNSIYTLDASLGRAEYEAMYTGDASNLPAAVRQAIKASVGEHIVVIQASSNYQPTSDAARSIVNSIRADRDVGHGGTVLVAGETATDLDTVRSITERTPLAVGFVVLVTYLVLFLLTGSIVLPLKAVLLNLLSIGAAFGALVWIFQQGHLSQLLGFTPQSLDPSIPVILFSIVFGMSMDYEVLLVSRIQEEYLRTGDNTRAVADGLERSGRLITGAALIMVAVFMAFGLAEVVLIKAIGIGLAIAVAIDATLVRALAVPALMRLLGDLNWWAPKPLRWLHSRVGLSESGRRLPTRGAIFPTTSIPEPQSLEATPIFVAASVTKESIS
jgi:RND superfamily putative drug exporter